MVTKRRSSRKTDNPGSSSVESLNDETRLKLLDLQPLTKAFEEPDIIGTADKEGTNNEEKEEDIDKNDENISTPKMNTIVGFLRISNFISATTVVFLLLLNLMTAKTWTDDPSQNLVTTVQIVFLSFVTLLIAIDSIGTVSFCWREYGELSSLHTDATSIIFILCSNRWIFRLGSGLLLMTALSLPIMRFLEEQNTLPHTLPWIAALVSLSFVSAAFGSLLSFCTPHYRIPWLSGTFDVKLVRDDDDVWKEHGHQFKRPDDWRQQSKIKYCTWCLQQVIQVLGMILCFTAFVIATSFHVVTLIALTSNWPTQSGWSNVFLLSTILVCIVLELMSMGVLVVRSCKKQCSRNTWSNKSWIPLFIWIIAPHLLSCGVREFMEANLTKTLAIEINFAKYGLIFTWTNVMVPMVWFGLIYILIGFFVNGSYVKAFWTVNFNNDRMGSRKIIRLMDTMATIFMLASMIIGFASLFIDQYDIDFDPDGFVKDVVDACKEFETQINPVMIQLNKVVDAIDKHYTCETVYSVLGTGTALTIFASFFPGAGTVASAGSRSAYYGVRTANALTNLAQRLKRSMSTVWSVSRTVTKVSFFMGKNMKKIILASNSVDIGRMLPLLPPVILGLYVMFGVFWPNRIVFFTAKQRRNHMSKRFWSWTLALIVLLVAILINTIILDELVELLDDNMKPVAKVQLKVNLGWKLAMTASALSLFGTFLNWIIALVFMISTNNDHENLTNAEIDWKNELEKRELVTIRTALGNVYQKRTHLKYKRSRISPWTWCLPILLTLMACGFGVLANFYPKLEMIREPRGPFGRQLDKLYRKVSLFENDKDDVVKDTELECLPLATIDDVLHSRNGHHLSNVLMQPVDKFFNMTDIIIGPIKKNLNKFRDNLILGLDEEIFEGNMDEHWQNLKELKNAQLPYVGLIFTIPRLICLLILIFGCFMASIFQCNMRIICQSLEPRKIVDAYGKVALFSLIYVLGAQLSLVNLLTSFGVPFYHIYVKFSAGFVYDVVADSILIATYIGMNNEFFFAIPKRKTTVTYEVPGVSDPGPNEQGQII